MREGELFHSKAPIWVAFICAAVGIGSLAALLPSISDPEEAALYIGSILAGVVLAALFARFALKSELWVGPTGIEFSSMTMKVTGSWDDITEIKAYHPPKATFPVDAIFLADTAKVKTSAVGVLQARLILLSQFEGLPWQKGAWRDGELGRALRRYAPERITRQI